MYLVSSCLCGNRCRYSGTSYNPKAYPLIEDLLVKGLAVPVCPEVLGGLSIPRFPAEIVTGTGIQVIEGVSRVINLEGADVTPNYLSGAKKALLIALQTGCRKAILKSKSPACGVGAIYSGAFDGTLVNGDGVFAALLKKYKFTVFSEEDFDGQPEPS